MGWLAVVLAGCPAHLPPAGPSRARVGSYRVAALAASAERVVTSLYDLEVSRQGDGVWVIRTTHSEGILEEGDNLLAYDSARPRRSDPWPLTLQHAIAAVPVAVRFDPEGAPVSLVDPAQWRRDALAAVDELGLPAEASPAALPLLDPEGLLRDLRRTFPGTPPPLGAWSREASMAGVEVAVVETCTPTRSGPTTTWDCTGEVEAHPGAAARFREAHTTTRLVADRFGLLSQESSYEGFLILADPDGRVVVERAVAGRRLVERR